MLNPHDHKHVWQAEFGQEQNHVDFRGVVGLQSFSRSCLFQEFNIGCSDGTQRRFASCSAALLGAPHAAAPAGQRDAALLVQSVLSALASVTSSLPNFLHPHVKRILELLPAGSVVADVFAGIGPFAVPAAVRGCAVYANDLNPKSHEFLVANVRGNKVEARVRTSAVVPITVPSPWWS